MSSRHADSTLSKLPTKASASAISWVTGHSSTDNHSRAPCSVSCGRASASCSAASALRRYSSAPNGPSTQNQNSTPNQRRSALRNTASTSDAPSSGASTPGGYRRAAARRRDAASGASSTAATSRSRSRGPQHQNNTTMSNSRPTKPHSGWSSATCSRPATSNGTTSASAMPHGPRQRLPSGNCALSHCSQLRYQPNWRRPLATPGARWPMASAMMTASNVADIARFYVVLTARERRAPPATRGSRGGRSRSATTARCPRPPPPRLPSRWPGLHARLRR